MGIRILAGRKVNESDAPGAALYCSTSGLAFGPMFADESEAESFLRWSQRYVVNDLRHLTSEEVANHVNDWRVSVPR